METNPSTIPAPETPTPPYVFSAHYRESAVALEHMMVLLRTFTLADHAKMRAIVRESEPDYTDIVMDSWASSYTVTLHEMYRMQEGFMAGWSAREGVIPPAAPPVPATKKRRRAPRSISEVPINFR